jgi:7-cyano-7-deazaguanine synthase
VILLLSGGLDSIMAYRFLGSPRSIYFHLGTRGMSKEIASLAWVSTQEWARDTVEHSTELDLGAWEQTNGYLPYRNALLVLLAAERDPVVCVAQVNEWAPDKNIRFWASLASLMDHMTAGSTQGVSRRHRIVTPFVRYTKGDLLLAYRRRFGRPETRALLQQTWSCYEAGDVHCGVCSGCVQRAAAEARARMRDTVYKVQPHWRVESEHWRDVARWMWTNRTILGPARRWREQRMI